MNLLNKLTIKNLKLNKKRTIVTIIGIVLSVALITAVASMYSSGVESLIKYETAQKGNFHVAFYGVPIEDLDVFKNNREIENINLTKNIGYAKINSKNEDKPYAFVKAFTKSSLENLSIRLVEGRLPENVNEIVIPTHLKTNGRLTFNIGDNISLDIGKRMSLVDNVELDQTNPFQSSDYLEEELEKKTISEENDKKAEDIVNTTSKTYKIVGIIERPATNIESYFAPGYTFITYMDDNDLSDNVDIYARYTKDGIKNAYKLTANILGVDEELFEKVSTGEASFQEMEKYNKEISGKMKYDISINNYLIGLETNPIASSQIVGLGAVLCIVIAIIIFTSVFCIKNSFDISITEKIKQYGMLRSIGATKKQIKKNVFYEATILGIIGIPLGIIFGFLASFILVLISNYYFGKITSGTIELKFHFSLIAGFVSIILGIVTIYFSAFRSAKRASIVSPIDSIRNSANIKLNAKKLKSPKLIKKLFGIGGEISYKNIKRNKKKYRTTVISLATSVFVFIGLSAFMSMTYSEVREELDYLEYNLALNTSSVTNENLNNFVNTTTFDNIEESSIIRSTNFNFQNVKYNKEYLNLTHIKEDDNLQEEYMSVYAMGKQEYQKYIKNLGLDYDNIKDKAILYDYHEDLSIYDEEVKNVKRKIIRVFDYKVNDKISGNLENNENYTFEIGAISKELPFGLRNVSGKMLFISDELFDKITDTTRLQIFYKANNASKLQDDIDNYLTNEIYSLDNSEENVKMMENLLTLVGIFLYGFIIVVSLIGITNIFNTITTNMELRRQEFAMLKSVGMTKKEFNKMIRLESIFIGCKSLIIGIPIGVIISYMIYKAFNGVSYNFPISSILISIITVFILIILIMKYSINKINKQNTIETIRNDNI